MSELDYQEQSLTDLEYKLFTAKNFDHQLNVLDTLAITWQDYLFSFSIIGSSHLVEIELSNKKLIEILACVKVEEKFDFLYNKGLKINLGFEHSRLLEDSIKYNFNLRIINFENQNKYQDFNYSLQQEEENKLYYIFPGDNAVTSIEIMNNDEELKWITYHSYTKEKQVVKTITTLSV